jgi:hypothetical protein
MKQSPVAVSSGATFSIDGKKTEFPDDPLAQMAMSFIKPANKCLGKFKIKI